MNEKLDVFDGCTLDDRHADAKTDPFVIACPCFDKNRNVSEAHVPISRVFIRKKTWETVD